MVFTWKNCQTARPALPLYAADTLTRLFGDPVTDLKSVNDVYLMDALKGKKKSCSTPQEGKKRTLFGPPWLDIIIDDSLASLYIIIKPAARNMGAELNGDPTFEQHFKQKSYQAFFFF